jgi:hypothetical protein
MFKRNEKLLRKVFHVPHYNILQKINFYLAAVIQSRNNGVEKIDTEIRYRDLYTRLPVNKLYC